MTTPFGDGRNAAAPRCRAAAAALLGAILAGIAAAPAQASEPVEIVDAADRTVVVDDTSRVVSIGGSVTEVLYGLGLENSVIAVDTTSLFPARALEAKPNVGYMRALSPEGILSLQPSLILAEEGSGPPETIEILKEASVPFVLVPSAPDATGVVDKIRFVSKVMGQTKRGKLMSEAVMSDLSAVEDAVATIRHPARVLFVLSLANGQIMAAGEDTSAQSIIELAGAENALTGFTGFKPVNAEAVIEAAPDVIVMMARGDHAAAAEEVFAHPALARTPAAADKRLVTMDGLYLLGFGPRVAQAAGDLASAIYPELPNPDMPGRPWAIDKPRTEAAKAD